jgi:uncharacterized membrane protein YtjA (UPF0391 family)
MLGWVLLFLIVAIIAAIFGFGGIAAGAVAIAKIIFWIFIVLFVISSSSAGIQRRLGLVRLRLTMARRRGVEEATASASNRGQIGDEGRPLPAFLLTAPFPHLPRLFASSAVTPLPSRLPVE